MTDFPNRSLDDVRALVRDAIVDKLRVNPADITDDARLQDLSGADSVRLLLAMTTIERQVGFELDDRDIFGDLTFGRLVTLVHDGVVARV